MHNLITIEWKGQLVDGKAVIIDQTLLPCQYELLNIETIEQMWDAIYKLKIRGAPAIGIAAAYGLVLGVRKQEINSMSEFFVCVQKCCDYLKTARPTAVNLAWALHKMQSAIQKQNHVEQAKIVLWQKANAILREDNEICHAIGDNGKILIRDNDSILTHCNAGGLATASYGTALAVIFSAFSQGKKIHVYVDETRPLWQGARLTTWELQQRGIPVTLICDNTAAFLMQQKKINLVIVGADRIASNGDTANKIGTYNVALIAAAHNIPFYVAAPISTFDFSIQNGGQIPIEERSASEVVEPYKIRIAPKNVSVYCPAFDVTPAKYIAGIITEHSILKPPLEQAISKIKN